MATVKTKFRILSGNSNGITLYYQVIHNRIARQINTDYELDLSEWNAERSELCVPQAINQSRRDYLLQVSLSLKEDAGRLKRIIRRLEQSGEMYLAEEVVELFQRPTENEDFVAFAQRLVSQMVLLGKKRTAETYNTATNSFLRFRDDLDVPLEEVDSNLMMGYESYLKNTGVCPNTISFYMRNLRAIYNRAVENGLMRQCHPFKHVYTGIGKTTKRAVPLKTIRQIRDLDLTRKPLREYSRDMFMFSFYTRGMSLIDMAHLKKKDLQNGVLSYRRKKTGQQLFVKWEKQMQEIVDKYDTPESFYLLPIIQSPSGEERRVYRNAAHLINRNLKKIGEQLALSIPLTSYVARHAWASIAKSRNIAVSTISEAMGHDSERTTRIYLASLDTTVVDRANRLVLRSL